jgi:hypothetical protein
MTAGITHVSNANGAGELFTVSVVIASMSPPPETRWLSARVVDMRISV